ncbi:type IX secretion system membrane protein PorP/SprF [Fulvivirgaceae bacterium PWU5]|uniref:Type IX secretion system membrane protein PorP/SprF n=1 Tax=Dawidia cretensis TaxID=2782350 RepID=A0AAP2DXI5_9BACT|nr:type IX secretion system membrane protein PorP/SprF [Dawidia cretensis]MBT1707569.1 type IX secretion system membrane protein PorP/SprF [Dawidia cretensis]
MKRFFTILAIVYTLAAKAQDPEFSQYYAAPLYLNPAFAGTSEDHRFMANYRNQWPNITTAFETYAFSYDYNLSSLNSGLGVLILADKAGSANLKSTQFNLQYAYKVRLSDKWVLSAGLNFGVGFRTVDYNRLVFYEQLEFDQDGINLPPPTDLGLKNTTYFDFGGGILAYNRKFWIGMSTSHINRPNRSMLNSEAQIPIKTTIHGGVRIPLYHGLFKKDRVAALAPSFVYKAQGTFDQLDIGTYFLYEPLVLGLWYRGIPIKQNVRDNISQDAVVVILGFQLQKVELTYSYDVTVSDLGPISGGAHEIALKFKVDLGTRVKTRKKERFIPCPTFNKD